MSLLKAVLAQFAIGSLLLGVSSAVTAAPLYNFQYQCTKNCYVLDPAKAASMTWSSGASPVVSSSDTTYFAQNNVVTSLGAKTFYYYTEPSGGGFDTDGATKLSFYAAQLFTGSTATPTFQLGTYVSDDGFSTLNIFSPTALLKFDYTCANCATKAMSWTGAQTPSVAFSDSNSFILPIVTTSVGAAEFVFWNDANFGGFVASGAANIDFRAPQLYTGPTSLPTFLLGSFTSDSGAEHLNISVVPEEVPEPAPFALLGLGAIALAASRRRKALTA